VDPGVDERFKTSKTPLMNEKGTDGPARVVTLIKNGMKKV